MELSATASERAYIKEVLHHFKAAMPEATLEQRRALASKTLFRLRLWDVIYCLRKQNYKIRDVLDAEFIEG